MVERDRTLITVAALVLPPELAVTDASVVVESEVAANPLSFVNTD